MDPQKRAPGWKVRCLKCGFTEDEGKYGFRKWATGGRSYEICRCSRCRWLRCYVIYRPRKEK